MIRCVLLILALALALALAASPRAQVETPADEPRPAAEPEGDPERGHGFFSGEYARAQRPMWFAEAEGNAWYVSPGGDVSIGGSPLVPTADLNLDSPRATPMVEAVARFDPFSVSFRGSLLDVDDTAILPELTRLGVVNFAAGEMVRASYRLDEAVARLGYRLYQFDSDPDERGRPLLSAGVDLLGGMRMYDGSVGVTGPSGSVGSSFTHIEPLIGFAADVTFADRYEIQIQNTHGGTPKIDGQSSFTVDIQVTFKWRPVENAALQIGYRIRSNKLEDEDYELDGAVAGVFAGVSVRF